MIANKTYKLEAAVGGASVGYAYYGWIDNSNNLLSGGSIGAVIKAGNVHTDAPQDKAVVYFTPTVDTRVFLRVYNLFRDTNSLCAILIYKFRKYMG